MEKKKLDTNNIIGEKEIERILKENKILFDRKKKIVLPKDTKKYRIPDFFLPKQKIVIEYFGSWHNKKNKSFEKKERNRFLEKIGAYKENKIKFIGYFPEDFNSLEEKILSEINKTKIKKKETTILIKNNEKKIIEPEKKELKEVNKTDFLNETQILNHRKKLNKNNKDDLLKKIILGLNGISIILFVFQIILSFLIFLEGNPLISDFYAPRELFFNLFIITIIFSIILSAYYAFVSELSKGFIYVSIIFLIFFFITSWFFGDPLIRTIIILTSIFGVIPTQYYMLTSD